MLQETGQKRNNLILELNVMKEIGTVIGLKKVRETMKNMTTKEQVIEGPLREETKGVIVGKEMPRGTEIKLKTRGRKGIEIKVGTGITIDKEEGADQKKDMTEKVTEIVGTEIAGVDRGRNNIKVELRGRNHQSKRRNQQMKVSVMSIIF